MKAINDFSNISEVSEAFTSIGGRFLQPAEIIKTKLQSIKAFVCDWDGVFNNGFKSDIAPSVFSEVDAAGLNLMRYSYYNAHKSIPLCSLITGEENPAAVHLTKRENIHFVFMKVLNKIDAINHLCKRHNITPAQVACVFDDMNDLSMARVCGLRFMINKSCNPAFQSFVINNNMCDYITGNEQPNYPLREICELVTALTGNYEQCILSRANFDDMYRKYLEQKKSVKPNLVRAANVGFLEKPAQD